MNPRLGGYRQYGSMSTEFGSDGVTFSIVGAIEQLLYLYLGDWAPTMKKKLRFQANVIVNRASTR